MSRDKAASQQAQPAAVVRPHLSAVVIHVKAPSAMVFLVGDLKAMGVTDLLRLKLGI